MTLHEQGLVFLAALARQQPLPTRQAVGGSPPWRPRFDAPGLCPVPRGIAAARPSPTRSASESSAPPLSPRGIVAARPALTRNPREHELAGCYSESRWRMIAHAPRRPCRRPWATARHALKRPTRVGYDKSDANLRRRSASGCTGVGIPDVRLSRFGAFVFLCPVFHSPYIPRPRCRSRFVGRGPDPHLTPSPSPMMRSSPSLIGSRSTRTRKVWLDPKTVLLIVRARVCLREGPLEHLLCSSQTKEHESILASDRSRGPSTRA